MAGAGHAPLSALLKPFERIKTVERKVLLLIGLLVGAMALYQVVRVQVNRTVRINGPLYQSQELRQALYADIVRPRLYVHDLYLSVDVLVERARHGDRAEVAKLTAAFRARAADYRTLAQYWRGQQVTADVRVALERSLASGEALLQCIEEELLPLVERHDILAARQLLDTQGVRLFAAHQAAAAQAGTVLNEVSERSEAAADRLADQFGLAIDLAAVLAFGMFTWILLVGLRQVVLHPLQRARRQFEVIGGGDYSTPVLTRRQDEFGDMLRALERMRASLAGAIEAREEILQRSLQGFYQSTLDGRFLSANPAMASMLGYEDAEALVAEPAGTTDRMYVDRAQRREFVRLMESQGFVTGFEAALRRRDGRVIWVTETARTVTDGDTGRVFREGFIDDITSRKESEQLKADFISFVTHQLRTPLAGIRWMLELAQQDTGSAESAACLEDARLSAERLIALVNDLLDVARLENGRIPGDAEPTSLAALARALAGELAPLAEARQQRITLQLDTVPMVVIDPQLARQALLNLVSNAIKYTPHGGAVTVCVAERDGVVQASVRDTGIGIPTAAQARLFEKFFRADNAQMVDTEGTGLGLYLVRLIAEQAGGAVACESQEGEGSTFTLTLPVADEQKAVA